MSDAAVHEEVSNALTVNRLSAALKRCRHAGMTDHDTAIALLSVVDSCDAAEARNQDDLDTIRRIGHGMQRGDTKYCLAELAKAKGRAHK